MVEVEVALATYNGAAWLPAQLGSLARQSCPAHILVGDDGSQDSTREVLYNWASRCPGGLQVLADHPVRLGPAANFARILAASGSAWVACCDQDDVWDPEHIEVLWRAGVALECRFPVGTPVLAVGDMRVVDSQGAAVHPSFWGMQGFDPILGASLGSLAVMNVFPGCVMLANRALLQAALPLPRQAVMHDWWLALVAAALGGIAVVRQPLGSYRLHGGNTLGATHYDWGHRWRRLMASDRRVATSLEQACGQCDAVAIGHWDRLAVDRRQLLEVAAALPQRSWLLRRTDLLRHGIGKHPWSRQMNLLLRG